MSKTVKRTGVRVDGELPCNPTDVIHTETKQIMDTDGITRTELVVWYAEPEGGE